MASKRPNAEEEMSHDHKIRREDHSQKTSTSRGEQEDGQEEEDQSTVQGGTVTRVQRRATFTRSWTENHQTEEGWQRETDEHHDQRTLFSGPRTSTTEQASKPAPERVTPGDDNTKEVKDEGEEENSVKVEVKEESKKTDEEESEVEKEVKIEMKKEGGDEYTEDDEADKSAFKEEVVEQDDVSFTQSTLSPTETPQEYQDLHGPQQKPVLGFPIQISDEEQILPFGTVDPHHLASHSWSTLESNTKRVITLDQSTASSENFQGSIVLNFRTLTDITQAYCTCYNLCGFLRIRTRVLRHLLHMKNMREDSLTDVICNRGRKKLEELEESMCGDLESVLDLQEICQDLRHHPGVERMRSGMSLGDILRASTSTTVSGEEDSEDGAGRAD